MVQEARGCGSVAAEGAEAAEDSRCELQRRGCVVASEACCLSWSLAALSRLGRVPNH